MPYVFTDDHDHLPFIDFLTTPNFRVTKMFREITICLNL